MKTFGLVKNENTKLISTKTNIYVYWKPYFSFFFGGAKFYRLNILYYDYRFNIMIIDLQICK